MGTPFGTAGPVAGFSVSHLARKRAPGHGPSFRIDTRIPAMKLPILDGEILRPPMNQGFACETAFIPMKLPIKPGRT